MPASVSRGPSLPFIGKLDTAVAFLVPAIRSVRSQA